MNIAIIVPSLTMKAPVIVALQLAEGFIDQGHSVCVFYFDDIIELELPCASQKIGKFDFKLLEGYDIIHSHCFRPDVFAWGCKILQGNRGIFVTTIHNIVEEELAFWYGNLHSRFFSKIWRYVWRAFNARIVLTDQALNYYRSSESKLSYTRIYNGRSKHQCVPVNAEDESIINLLKNRYKLIGACAVVSRRKGLEQIIKALPFLENYAFLLIGDGPELNELLQLSQSLNVGDRFISMGQRANARDYLPYMDIYVMPSRSEGLPLALLEAISEGVPAVCSDIPQFLEIFSDNEVFIFHLDDIPSLINAIREVDASGVCFSNRALIRFDSCYTQDVMVRQYLSCFSKLLSQAQVI